MSFHICSPLPSTLPDRFHLCRVGLNHYQSIISFATCPVQLVASTINSPTWPWFQCHPHVLHCTNQTALASHGLRVQHSVQVLELLHMSISPYTTHLFPQRNERGLMVQIKLPANCAESAQESTTVLRCTGCTIAARGLFWDTWQVRNWIWHYFRCTTSFWFRSPPVSLSSHMIMEKDICLFPWLPPGNTRQVKQQPRAVSFIVLQDGKNNWEVVTAWVGLA